MAIPILVQNAQALCPHGGKVNLVPTYPRVRIGGQMVITRAAVCTVAGCPYQLPTVPPTPSPCLTVVWNTSAVRVKAGAPVLLQSSQGLCMGPSGPQGPVNILFAQPRVKGT